jgi:hypothetical protein
MCKVDFLESNHYNIAIVTGVLRIEYQESNLKTCIILKLGTDCRQHLEARETEHSIWRVGMTRQIV